MPKRAFSNYDRKDGKMFLDFKYIVFAVNYVHFTFVQHKKEYTVNLGTVLCSIIGVVGNPQKAPPPLGSAGKTGKYGYFAMFRNRRAKIIVILQQHFDL